MRKKLVRLTESDLHRIVNRAIKEEINEYDSLDLQKSSSWIARDEDGKLWLFAEKPYLEEYDGYKRWRPKSEWSLYDNLYEKFFPEITVENSPKEIILR